MFFYYNKNMNKEPNLEEDLKTNDFSGPLENLPSYEEHMIDHRKTFGEGVSEVFDQEKERSNGFIDGWEKYKERAREERELLETLDSERAQFQDYIFAKAINDNPNGSEFIKKGIPDFDASKPITPQLLAKNKDGTYKLSDETVGNILEFYNHVMKEEKGKFKGEVEKTQSNYEANLRKRVESGTLPKALLSNYEFKKQQNGGLIFDGVSLFDMRPEDESSPTGVAAYIEHRGIDDTGKIIDSKDTRKIMYKKAFIPPGQTDQLGSVKIAMNHELTHIIAGTEASFNLLKDSEITEAYREGMTEAIGQMISDDGPEADRRGLQYYLESKNGTYRAERNFLSRLINADNRLLQETGRTDETSLESLFLDAYADMRGDKPVDLLRQRLLDIFENWESVIRDEDFPECNVFEFSRGVESRAKDWEWMFCLALKEMRYKAMIEYFDGEK